MKVDLIVFDMAGTTVDEDNVVYKTVRKAINEAGYAFSQEQVQAAGAGKEKSEAIRVVLALNGKEPPAEEVQRIFEAFRIMLAEAYQNLEVKAQPGAESVFKQLRSAGVKVVLNTGYDRATAEGLIGKLDWQVGRDIDALVTASDVSKGRPHPDMIVLAMSQLGVAAAARVAKVGDSQVDIEEGKRAGCGYTFGITTGAQSREQLLAVEPSAVVDSLAEMVSCLAAES